MVRLSVAATSIAFGVVLAGFCGCALREDSAAASQPKVHAVGEAVEAGLIRYTVIGTEWRDRIGEGANAVAPAQRFLTVQISAFNRSSDDQLIPPLALMDSEDHVFSETAGLEAEPRWLGSARKVPGNDSRQGLAVFDVHPGRYVLRLTDNTGQERHALVDLPVELPH